MDFPIFVLLTQDGITNGAVYALLALALVLVFAVTRVIWIPSGEFVAYGTLTLAGLQLGKPPGTVGLLVGMAVVAGAMEVVACARRGEPGRIPRQFALWTGIPIAIAGVAWWLATPELPLLGADPRDAGAGHRARAAAVPDRLPAAGRGERAGAADRLRRGALHADGASDCWFFGAEGSRTPAFSTESFDRRRRERQPAEPARRVHQPRADRRALPVLRPHAVRQGAARDGVESRRRAPGRHVAQRSQAR